MKRVALVTACLLLATPVLAETVAEKSGVNTVLGIAPSTADFVKEAAISDMFEIKESQLAVDRGDAATKSFAQQMITDHQKTSEDLKSMIDDGKIKHVVLPTALDSSHQSKLDTLSSEQGAAFLTQYHSDQVSAHKTAVSLFNRYAKGGKNHALKDWAGETLPTLQDHLKMAKALDK